MFCGELTWYVWTSGGFIECFFFEISLNKYEVVKRINSPENQFEEDILDDCVWQYSIILLV